MSSKYMPPPRSSTPPFAPQKLSPLPTIGFRFGTVGTETSFTVTLGAVLKEAGVKTTIFGAKETTHVKLNDSLGVAGDPATKVLLEFVDACLK